LGFEPQGLATARIDLPFTVYSTAEKIAPFSRALLEKVRSLPGVADAALGANPPLLSGWQIPFSREGQRLPPAQRPETECEVVSPDYFSTLQTPVVRGRALNNRDTQNAPLVVVIDQTFADQVFPGRDPIGQRLLMEPFDEGEGDRLF